MNKKYEIINNNWIKTPTHSLKISSIDLIGKFIAKNQEQRSLFGFASISFISGGEVVLQIEYIENELNQFYQDSNFFENLVYNH